MTISIFQQAFAKLSSRKKAIILDYCRLYEDSTLDVGVCFDRIGSIWMLAIEHPDLIACLELIDYIHSEFVQSETDEYKRIYLSEHLINEVGLEDDYSVSIFPDL